MRSAFAAALTAALTLVLVQAGRAPAAADYLGPIIDGNSHLPNLVAIDSYVAAMKRHNVTRVVLLGIGAGRPDEAAWIDAAAQKYPALVVAGLRVPEPLNRAEAGRLDVELARTRARVMGEVHIRHAVRKLERDPSAPGVLQILELAGQRGVPVVIHHELTPAAAASLEAALAAHRQAIIVLAHAGKSSPAVLEPLLTRNANLRIDLSGMNFQNTPALAKEKGPLDPKWKALIVKMPDRFLIGLNLGAAKHFEPPTLDRVMSWTRRILGELPPAVAERVAWQNATRLYHLD